MNEKIGLRRVLCHKEGGVITALLLDLKILRLYNCKHYFPIPHWK